MRVAGLVFLSDTENVLTRVDVGHFEKIYFYLLQTGPYN